MRKHVSAASAILAALTLSVAVAPAAYAANDPATRAVRYLASQQAADGSLDSSLGETADFVQGAAAAGYDPSTITSSAGNSPLDFLGAAVDSGYSGLNAGSTAKLILAAVAGRKDPTAFGKATKQNLPARLQSLYNATTGAYGDGQTFTQALAMLADAAAGQPVPPAAAAYLGKAQDGDGSWNYLAVKDNPAGGDTNSTALALEGLAAAGDHSHDAAALTWLHTQQQPDGGFPYQGSPSDPDSDAVVIQGILAAGQQPQSAAWSYHGTANTPVSNLASMQSANGGFAYPGNPGPDAFTTSQVPAALVLQALPVAPRYAAATSLASAGQYHSLATPSRILDTRGGAGALQPGESRTIPVTGAVPAAGLTAVVMNVTATGTTASSFLTVWPSGSPMPSASSLNWNPGDTVSNQVTVAVNDGSVAIYNLGGAADVVIDVAGYFAAPTGGNDGAFNPSPTSRLLDTRSQGPSLGPGTTRTLQVTAPGTTGIAAAVLNVTVTNTTSAGYLTAFQAGAAVPTASNLNWVAGQTRANRVTVKLDSQGRASFYNSGGSTDLVVDLNGLYSDAGGPAGSQYFAVQPSRVSDTRAGGGSLVPVAGRGWVPLMTAARPPVAVNANVTVTNTTAASYLSVVASNNTSAPTSDLNWSAGQTVPNAVISALGPDGALRTRNFAGSADVIVDLVGWYG